MPLSRVGVRQQGVPSVIAHDAAHRRPEQDGGRVLRFTLGDSESGQRKNAAPSLSRNTFSGNPCRREPHGDADQLPISHTHKTVRVHAGVGRASCVVMLRDKPRRDVVRTVVDGVVIPSRNRTVGLHTVSFRVPTLMVVGGTMPSWRERSRAKSVTCRP
jgi:hypothetical protein